jgi:flavin-dependent dehydrogenase
MAQESARGADVTWRLAQRTAGPGWLLVDDAAAQLDPSSSHGVLRALMSGMRAAWQVSADDCGGYHAWLAEGFEHDALRMRAAYREAQLFGA